MKRLSNYFMILCYFIAFLSTFSVVHATTITTPIFNYDSNRQAVAIDMGQFPLDFQTEMHFVFSESYPNQTQGGAIFWNRVNRIDAGVFYGSLGGRSYFWLYPSFPTIE